MKHILAEDSSKIAACLGELLKGLGNGMKRCDLDITIGDDVPILHAKGYWVGDMIRIDINFEV